MLQVYGILYLFSNCELLTFVLCLICAELSLLLVRSFLPTLLRTLCAVSCAGSGSRWPESCALARRARRPAASGRCGSAEAAARWRSSQRLLGRRFAGNPMEEFLPPLCFGAIRHGHP